MKHLKKFENFYLSPDVETDEQEFIDHSKNIRNMKSNDLSSQFSEEEEEFSDDEFPEEDEFTDDDQFSDDDFSEEEDEFSDDEFSDDEFSDDEFSGEDEFIDDDQFSNDEFSNDDFSEEEDEFSGDEFGDEFPGGHIMKFEESKKSSYKKGKKSKPDFLDIDKDGNKKESMKKAKEDKKDTKGSKGLTAAQKKLPEGLRKAIEARKKK